MDYDQEILFCTSVWLGAVTVAAGLVTERSPVRLWPRALPGNNSGQVVHTHIPVSPNNIIWCHSRGGDAVWLER